MKKLLISLMVVLLTACASTKDKPVNVLVMVQDDISDAIPATSSQMQRFVRAVSGDLDSAGVNVYDASTEFTYSGETSKAAILDMARSYSRAPIDYVIILSAVGMVDETRYSNRVSTIVSGQTLAPGSGRYAGSFTVDGRTVNTDPDCTSICLHENIGDSLMSTTGEVTEQILSSLPSRSAGKQARKRKAPDADGPAPTEFMLTFDGFSNQEMTDIEEYLTIFSGYQSMRYANKSREFAEVMYRAAISRNKLSQNLNRVLNELEIEGTVRVSGNSATISKSQPRSSRQDDLNSWEE